MKKFIWIFAVLVLAACAQSDPARVAMSTQALLTPAPTLETFGGWTVSEDARYLGGTAHWTALQNDYVTLSITGYQIGIIYTGRPGRGNAAVYVDNELLGTFSQYVKTATYQMVWYSPPFRQGSRIITIVNVDAGKSIDVDAVRVYNNDTIFDLCDPTYVPQGTCIYILPE